MLWGKPHQDSQDVNTFPSLMQQRLFADQQAERSETKQQKHWNILCTLTDGAESPGRQEAGLSGWFGL